MNTVCIVQARLGSQRLPKKVIKELDGMPVFRHVHEQLSKSRKIDRIAFALADEPGIGELTESLNRNSIDYMLGPAVDVFERYHLASIKYRADVVVRITCDCPLLNPQLVDQLICLRESSGFDYVSNIDPPTFPNGLDVEVFSRESIGRLKRLTLTDYDREHVTPKIRLDDDFKRLNVSQNVDQSHLRMTLDTQEDYNFLASLLETYPDIKNFELSRLCRTVSEHQNGWKERRT